MPIVLLLLLLLCAPVLAREEIIPVPPDFVLDKQLPGEDPFWIERPTFSPDGKLVAAFLNKTVTVWDVKSGQVVATVAAEVHGMDALDGLEFNNDATRLLLLRNFQPLRYLDWKNGKVTREVPLNADPRKILDYTFSPDQSLLAVATSKGIHLWDLKKDVKLKEYIPEVPVCAVDYLEFTPPGGGARGGSPPKPGKVRLLAYAKPIMPPTLEWTNVAGIINLDSGAITPVLGDVPEDKKIQGKMTYFRVRWEWGGSHLLIGYYTLPPSVKAGLFLVDARTFKFSSNHDLEHLAVAFDPRYLGKPFWGFEVLSYDLTANPYKTAAQFIVPTRQGLKVLDTVSEQKIPMQSISINRAGTLAAVAQKASQEDKSRLYLYKLVPKKLK